ncbi:MAG: DUF4870 domain-containing protein [Leptolinea sp.]
MNDNIVNGPEQDECVMAGLSHMAALLPLIGVVAPVVIWVTQKDKSKYVSFQALQAVAYQFVMIVAYFLSMMAYMVSFFGTFIFLPFSESTGSESANPLIFLPILVPFLIFAGIFFFGFLFVAYGVFGGIMAFLGKPFRYLLVANWIERYMSKQSRAA